MFTLHRGQRLYFLLILKLFGLNHYVFDYLIICGTYTGMSIFLSLNTHVKLLLRNLAVVKCRYCICTYTISFV